jgi:hypothetical protein
MKTTGIIILVIGILLSVYSGFNFVTKKKVVDIGNLEITRDKNHFITWSPYAGVALIVIGGGLFAYSFKKEN